MQLMWKELVIGNSKYNIRYFHNMSPNIKVLYITKYNQKEIVDKPDNFAYYVKSMINSRYTTVKSHIF